MGSLLWILMARPKVIMKLLLGLALLVASASAFDLSKLRLAASPTADNVEYGFCEGSPEPASIDNISVEPFPILIQNGATVTLNVQITLNELLAVAETAGICPQYFPEGQACALPLNPGVYGGGDPLTLGPIESIPDILLPFLKGTINAEASFVLADGSLFACGFAKFAVDH